MAEAPPVLPGVLPLPRHWHLEDGSLSLHAGLRLATPPGAPARLLRLLERQQHRLDALLGPAHEDAPRMRIRVADRNGELPQLGDDESWRLEIGHDGGSLDATGCAGAAHGLERLLQYIARGSRGPELPRLGLHDAPRFPWRGLMIDLARHHMPLATLLRTLDGMAVLGLNVLHLHLNDDQGFRVETPRCPELHARSGRDGYLDRDEVTALVTAAGDRGIRVVPELDVPGHAGALLWARPELAAGRPPRELPRAFGPSRHALDPTLDRTWELLEAVVSDLTELFPDPFLHLGGDEVHPDVYDFDDDARRAWARERGLDGPADVQAWFVAGMAGLLARHDRRPVGWDEVLHPEVPPAVVVQSWRGSATLETALAAGHDALFSAGWYLDLGYPASLHHGFDPGAGPDALADAELRVLEAPFMAPVRRGAASLLAAAGRARSRQGEVRGTLLGGEACLWSELVTPELLDVRLYGRLAAVAERLWSPPELLDVDDHYRRLPGLLAHLEATTDCRPLTGSAPLLLRLGVAPDELRDVETLLAALEPLRWYQRLLGPERTQQRSAAEDTASGMGSAERPRPRDADTPLLRPVDLLPPESLDLRDFAAQLQSLGRNPQDPHAAHVLRERAHRWREVREALADLRAREPAFAELGGHMDALAELADVLDARIDVLTGAALSEPPAVERLEALQDRVDLSTEITLAAADVLRQHVRSGT
ncbi:MAG: family 20 glycosylhydrolase [Gammaproteobacteria bacterium]|nr:family 20 glycosylhydrolase [Gammaproteobacteria bacterium]